MRTSDDYPLNVLGAAESSAVPFRTPWEMMARPTSGGLATWLSQPAERRAIAR